MTRGEYEDNMMTMINIKALMFCGLWPCTSKRYPLLGKIHSCYGKINKLLVLTFYISMTIQLVHVFTNIFELMHNLSVFVLYSIIIAKISLFVFKREKILNLLKKTNKFQSQVLDGRNDENKLIFMEYIKKIRAASILLWLMVLTVFNLFILPGYTGLFDIGVKVGDDGTIFRTLPFSCYLIFDQQKHYLAAFFLQIFLSTPGTEYVVIFDAFMFNLMMCAICQLKILQNSLTCLGRDKTKTVEQSTIDCYHLHQEIIEYIIDLDSLISNVLFLDFLVYGVLLCSIGFRIIFDTNVDIIIVISYTAYLTSMLIQLFVFYWPGHLIMEESVEVANAAFRSDWYDFQKPVVRSLILIMMRAQKPLQINIGKFYAMNLECLLIILRAWYSYMAVLNQTKQE